MLAPPPPLAVLAPPGVVPQVGFLLSESLASETLRPYTPHPKPETPNPKP